MLNEQLQKEIDLEAKAEAKKMTARVPAFRFGYEDGWNDAGKKYAEKWQAAEEKAARYEKALKLIAQMSDPGDYWKAICQMKSIAVDALTQKTGEDELYTKS